jgi:phosphate transport system substrate-binding protein
LAALALPMLAIGTAGAAKSKSTAPKLAPVTINGSGSTLQLAYDQQVIVDFKKVQPSVTINYSGVGSGAGRQAFIDGTVDFAGSDAPFPAADASKPKPYFYFPTVADPITVSYNLKAVSNLQLSADTTAKIFSRQIKTWDDPAIKAENPSAKLPSTAITVARRSDSSGTTQNFTTFLTKAAPSSWTLGQSSTINWPSDTQGASGNAGVAQIITKTDGAIGYVDFSDAQAIGLTYARIKNADGKYILPSTTAAQLAVAGATVNADLTYDPINVSGPKVYPITSPTYLIVAQTQSAADKGNAIVAFLNYIYGAGQVTAPKIDYAPLSKDLLSQAKTQVGKISVPAALTNTDAVIAGRAPARPAVTRSS